VSRVLVLGNATLDIVQRVDRLPVCGETLLGAAPSRCAGGKGLNQAIAAARAGADVDFVAAVGGGVGEVGLHVHTPNPLSSARMPANSSTPMTRRRITAPDSTCSRRAPIFAPSIMPTTDGTAIIGSTAPWLR